MSCMENYIKDANFADTGFSYTMSLISGKHKMVILYCLMEFEPVRFNEMKRYLGVITDKTLSSNLKDGDLQFVPERFDKTYLHWLENIRDNK